MNAGAPVLLLAGGPLGEAALERVVDALHGAEVPWAVLRTIDGDAHWDATLDRLAQVSGASPRLDVWLLVDRTVAPDGPLLPALLARLGARLDARLGAVFPRGLPPDQRQLAVHVVVGARALDASAEATLRELRAALSHPAAAERVARVWLCAARGPAGVLTDADLASTMACPALAAGLPPVRGEEAGRQLLGHPRPGEGPIVLLAGALASVPVGRLRRYARARAAWEAVARLQARCRPTSAAAARLPGWDPDGWTAPFQASGAGRPEGHAATVWRAEGPARGAVAIADAELGALAAIDGTRRGLLSGRLGAVRPLDAVAALELAATHHDAAPLTLRPPARLTPAEPAAAPPSWAPHAPLIGLSAGWLLAAAALRGLASAPAAAGPVSSTVIVSTAPAAAGPGLAWLAWLGGALAAAAVTVALRRAPRAAAAAAVVADGPNDALPSPLDRARARVLRAADVATDRVAERLATVRAGLAHTQAAMAAELDHVGATPGGRLIDDLPGVLGPIGLLHDHLLDADGAATWVERARTLADADAWADHVAVTAWPSGGVEDDVPAADPHQVMQLAEAQVAALRDGSPFDRDDLAELAASKAVAFLTRVQPALQRPVVPRDERADPVAGPRPGATITVVPAALRARVDALARRDHVHAGDLVADPRSRPHVVVLRTWEGLELDEVARGAGARA